MNTDTPLTPAIKAVFFDVDGTLIEFDTQKIPQNTRITLAKLKERGIRIFVCTGRPPLHAWRMDGLTDIPFDGFVLLNGQYCTDETRTCFYQHPLTSKQVECISDWMNEHPEVSCTYMEENYVYVNHHSNPETTYPPCDDPHRCLANTTYQITPMVPPEMDETLLASIPDIKTARWAAQGTDLIPADGGKSVGMQVMLDRFGLTAKETMAFGDGLNDIEMLQFARIGVAMGNGHPLLKEQADYVTKHIKEDGITHALKHFGVI